MIRLIAEQPMVVAVVLCVAAAAFVLGWLQTSRLSSLSAGGVALLLIPVAWYVSEKWVTDRELIVAILNQTAAAVAVNDHARALEIIGDPATRAKAAAELPRFEFHSAEVTRIEEMKIDLNTQPPHAEVDLIAKVQASEKKGAMKDVTIPRRLLLTFEKRAATPGGSPQWRVMEYQHRNVLGQADAYSSMPRP